MTLADYGDTCIFIKLDRLTLTPSHGLDQVVFASMSVDRRFHIPAPRMPKPAIIITQVLGSGAATGLTTKEVMAPAVDSVPLEALPLLMLTTL